MTVQSISILILASHMILVSTLGQNSKQHEQTECPRMAAQFLILSSLLTTSGHIGYLNTSEDSDLSDKIARFSNCLVEPLDMWHLCSRMTTQLGRENKDAIALSIRVLSSILRANTSASVHMDLAVKYLELGDARRSAYHSRRSIALGAPPDAWLNLASALDADSNGCASPHLVLCPPISAMCSG
jgi:hypothetical protein